MSGKLLRRNNRGQITKDFSILITKELQKLADSTSLNVKRLVRDELDVKFKDNMIKEYQPISSTGEATKEYNETHKHQKPQSYHHTGTLVNSIKTVIDGNTIKVIVEENTYEDGATTTQVYDWLVNGTTKHPQNDSYPYVKKQGGEYGTGWASYNPTPKHFFEEHTLEHMKGFLDGLKADLKNKNISKSYMGPYFKKKR